MAPASTCTAEIERLGFAIVPPPLEPSQLDALAEALADHPTPSSRGVYARRDVLDIPLVRQLCDGEVGALARQVLGDSAHPVRGLLFDKIPGANWKVPWHQDITIAVRDT